jgi:hypothetical protein
MDQEKQCYVEGVVEAITDPETHEFRDCARYAIRVDRRVFAGEEHGSVGELVYPPVNGTPSWLSGKPSSSVELVGVAEDSRCKATIPGAHRGSSFRCESVTHATGRHVAGGVEWA